ncbi:nucleotide disphospho-sugar-binding domain-containing protein [Actinoplanes sp. NPDC051475]|uniref:nucleotide disphospho-sugar-binding domain-containing protein n=1 Tax=Actinoplanes sp. NPDC051475 TaxID=3157225 RepID=UPI00344C21FF
MRVLFPAAPGYGLMLPIVPLAWAARAAGHDILFATTAFVTGAAANSGLPTVDVFPARDVGADLMLAAGKRIPADRDTDALPPGYWDLAGELKPFELFALAMTEGTVAAGRAFGADLVVYPADHAAGMLAAAALDVPALEVGNRVSWSLRDSEFRGAAEHDDRTGVIADDAPVITGLRDRLGLGERAPRLVARVDPRPPSLGGLTGDEPDPRDGVPWWSMRYVPYNGGAVLPEWALARPARPRICLTLGTVTPLLSDGSHLAHLLRALGELDAEVVLADHSTDLAALGPLPGNVRVAGYLPLSAFLDTCSLIVHHGGSGTTAAALHCGVPQLLLPEGADNPLVAERVVNCKAGLSLDPATLDTATFHQAVQHLLSDPAYADAAAAVAREMAAQPSPAAVLERLVTTAAASRP